MFKYKYESTQKIYEYINNSNDFFFSRKKIKNKFSDMDDFKIYKALSDLSRDMVIFRTDRGEYINYSESEVVNKIKNSRGERVKFNLIKNLVALERPEFGEKYNNIRMYKSPFYLAYDMFLTTQVPNLRVCIVDQNKNINLSKDLANISSVFIDEKNASKPIVYGVHDNTIDNLVIDFIKSSVGTPLENIVNIFNDEYSKVIEIKKRENSEESPYALSKYLYNKIDRHIYNIFIQEGLNNYIVKIK